MGTGHDSGTHNAFGKYRLVAELGQGGMADVLLASALGPVGFNKLIVVKRLRTHLADDPEFIGMLIDEARLAARLNHPNIVHTNEVGEIDGKFFIAMEYLEGQPLTRVRRRAERKQVARYGLNAELRILVDVLAGLHYAHELQDYDGTILNVVHRDVTPSNVFITYDGVVKLVDFGIAKAAGRTTETRTGVVKGKMTYMPPEQALGQEIDRRADIFSVGVVLWEAITGERMWKGIDDIVILGRLISGDLPASPRAVKPDVDEALDAICKKALAPDPNDRYVTAQDFQNDLEAFLSKATDVPSHREIGRLVSDLFNRERIEIKGIIEGQLTKMANDAISISPVVVPDAIASSATPSSTRMPVPIGSDPMLGGRDRTPSVHENAHEVPTLPPRRRSLLGLSLALIAAVGLLAYLLIGRTPDTAAEGAAATSSTSSAATDSVHLTLRATPAAARFSIDGGPWLPNPNVIEVPRDSGKHTIRIEAAGYEVAMEEVTFVRDVFIDKGLVPSTSPEPSASASSSSQRRGVTRPPREDDGVIVHPGKKKPPRTLDSSDPWKDD